MIDGKYELGMVVQYEQFDWPKQRWYHRLIGRLQCYWWDFVDFLGALRGR